MLSKPQNVQNLHILDYKFEQTLSVLPSACFISELNDGSRIDFVLTVTAMRNVDRIPLRLMTQKDGLLFDIHT